MDVKFEKFDEKYLELSWTWLNDPENKFLTNTSIFSKEEQLIWFKSLSERKDYKIWGISCDNVPIGATALKRIIDNTAYVSWYIGDKQFWGKRIGVIIAQKITEIARDLELKTLFAETIFENFRSLNLLFREGYKIVSVEKGAYLVRKDLI